ncbi:uncharacterized protein LOC122570529 [Bombus pyrosoma]|uniref:uncharacterized protein LOC122570529 n=1 Tax=Bombus pyrosoma TaxID=396416 RepID=UPI001CB95EC0|nr:uncharacterized protein LOC122570529 [Bombus pyrosoma]
MMLNAKILIIVGLVSYGVIARNMEGNKELLKEPSNKKHGVSMLMEIAKELVQRSSTSSQILNLNLSNLLLLLVLKAVVFGAGYLGHHGYKGRDLEEENVVSEAEVTLALGYLMGDTCLYRAACEEPHVAKEYLGAAEMIIQTIKLLPQGSSIEGKYEQIMAEFRKAIEHGVAGNCPPQYTCKKESIKNFLKEEGK